MSILVYLCYTYDPINKSSRFFLNLCQLCAYNYSIKFRRKSCYIAIVICCVHWMNRKNYGLISSMQPNFLILQFLLLFLSTFFFKSKVLLFDNRSHEHAQIRIPYNITIWRNRLARCLVATETHCRIMSCAVEFDFFARAKRDVHFLF